MIFATESPPLPAESYDQPSPRSFFSSLSSSHSAVRIAALASSFRSVCVRSSIPSHLRAQHVSFRFWRSRGRGEGSEAGCIARECCHDIHLVWLWSKLCHRHCSAVLLCIDIQRQLLQIDRRTIQGSVQGEIKPRLYQEAFITSLWCSIE